MLSQSRIWRSSLLFVAVLYGVELLDEFIYGLFGAALPTIKTELVLTYTQVGLLFTLPGLSGVMGEPIIGLLGDTRHRRALVLGGIAATAIGLTLIAGAQQYLPPLLGGIADALGLQTAMWLLIIGPIALIRGVR